MAKGLRGAGGPETGGRWDDPIKNDMWPIPSKPSLARLWEDVYQIHSHYVEFFSENKKGMTGYPELCPNWDPIKEEAVEGNCPLCAKGHKVQVHFYIYLIDRKAQTKTGATAIKVARITKKLAGKITRLSTMAYPKLDPDEAPDATDIKKGFDVWLSQTNNNNKVDYDANHSDKTPLTDEEIEAFEDFVKENNIARMVKAATKSGSDILSKLSNMGIDGFGKPKQADRGQSQQQTRRSRSYEDYDSPPEEPEGRPERTRRTEQEDAPPARTRARREEAEADADERPARPPARRASLTGDDDDEDVRPSRPSRFDDDDAPAPAARPTRRGATPSTSDIPDDDA